MTHSESTLGRSPLLRVATPPGRGETTLATAREAGDVPVVATGPTGVDAWEPLVAATRAGQTALFPAPDATTVERVAGTLADQLPTDGAAAVVDHDPETSTLPVPDSGPLAVGRRALLGPCGWIDPLAPADVPFVSTADLRLSAVDHLRGRGRGDAAADEPVGETWETIRDTAGDPVVVVNANESSERQQADRTLLAAAPLAVLDGAAAVARGIDATDVVVHLNESDRALGRRVRAAADRADALPVEVQVVAGPDEYRAGEPTAALEALEGADRVEPRLQPPGPATHGLYGRPTALHTPRTFAQVRRGLHDPSAFDPETADPGTRVLTVTGDVAAPATVELAADGSLESARAAVDLEGPFKLACVGGVLGGITRDLDVAPTAQSRRAAGLGTDAVLELLNERRCVVAAVGERARFAAEANSGRCVPGREGTVQLVELLREVYDGRLPTEEIHELGRVMARSSNCQVGAHAPRPVRTALAEFEPEFRAHADGRCTAGACGDSA
ncbi:NADH-ubiquinone oxidoreductase-F iron-sulfur binding region domain-containing protein [Halosegnis sp.]|uniref:NADH-ubiquinone oxidoreductase-F iron-sulfur binding region domain-containing protein n=1 Tax=Halosegnis sp. TaxID=2864959 RepID=UPI0035D465BC